MNILYHHRTQCRGVEGVHIREIAKALNNLGHQVDIASPSGIELSQNNNLNQSKNKARGLHTFISRFTPELCFEIIEIAYSFMAFKSLKAALRQKKYGLLYERYAIFNWAGVISAKKYNTPFILEINYTSHTPLYRKRSRLLKPLAHWMDKIIFAKADGFVAVSTYLKNHLIDLGVQESKIIVLPNAADPDIFIPLSPTPDIQNRYNLNRKKVIGFVGGFYPWHGLDFLLDCFHEVKKEIPQAHLLLIGDGPAKETLKAEAARRNLESDISFLGAIAHQELPKLIACFDVAVMPDSNEYGSPMKIYEYMSMGKPVIAPRLGPLEDGITNRREGIIFKQRDKNELVAALKELLNNDQLREQMSKAARENIVNNHSWKKNAEKIIILYQGIINL